MRLGPFRSAGRGLAWLSLLALGVTASPSCRPAGAIAAPEAPSFRLSEDGVSIDAGSLGGFTLQYPSPRSDWQHGHAIIEKNVAGNRVTLKYEGGGTLDLTLDLDGTIVMSPGSMSPDVKTLSMTLLLDFNFSQGGTWKTDDARPTPFPAQKPANPYLLKGQARRVTFTNNEGRTLTVELPSSSYTQLQDNREWGWKTFGCWFAMPYDRNTGTYRVKLSVGGAATARVLVDAFGQSVGGGYPAKVGSVEELKADVARERSWLDSLQTPPLDAYGGWPGSGSKLGLNKTGFFHVETLGAKWLLVDPEGNAFFQLGVCSMAPGDDYTYIAGREHVYAWLPPARGEFSTAYRPGDTTAFSFHLANRIRKTGRPFELSDYLSTMIERARKWGFNSAGAFSPTFEPAEKRANWPFVGQLGLSPWSGVHEIPGVAGAWDPFDEHNRQRVEQLFAVRVAPHADDPLLIGYFLANEPLYENLPKVLPTLKGGFACKQRLVQSLRDEYSNIAAFNQAWSAQAQSFDELADRGLAVTTDAARQDVRAFVGRFLDEYYRFVSETFRRYDRNHLLLGSRFQRGTIDDEQLCRICGKYMDVVSFNNYAYAIDQDFLGRVHAWSGNKPMLLSEFYYCSPSDSRLLGGGLEVGSQEQRGLAYRNYVEQSAALGYVVGIEWFTLVDQSITGRYFQKYNGENANTGLISVADRPWKPMLAHMMETNRDVYDVWFGQRAPFVLDDPRFRAGAAKN